MTAEPVESRSPSPALFEAMLRTRAVDDATAELSRRGVVGLHAPARGLEGAIHGTLEALGSEDWLFGDLRTGVAALGRGLGLDGYFAQVTGARGAADQGHSSPGEITWQPGRVVSSSSLLGTHLMHAAGVAHAMKVRGDAHCVVALFGPSSAATGDAHCAFNFAGVFRTPVVFVFCSAGEADAERLAGDFVDKGEGYGLPARSVDGADVVAVRECLREACSRARSGGGATLVEVRSGDALTKLAASLEAEGFDAAGHRQTALAALQAEIDDALAAVEQAGPPELGTLFDNVFAAPDGRLAEQEAGLRRHLSRFGGGSVQ